MNLKSLVLLLILAPLVGCSSLLRSNDPAPDVYLLAPATLSPTTTPRETSLVVARLGARAGLETDRLAVILADRRRDAYAEARWAAPLPRMVEERLIDGRRSTDVRRTVIAEGGHFRGRYLLQADITEFAADYSRGGSAPTVRVSLHGELGRTGERQVLANVSGSAAVLAVADRRREVVAAYQAAFDEALASLVAEVDAAISRAELGGP